MLFRWKKEQPKTTHCSEHGQDKFLDEVVFKGRTRGTFVEIGACDGIYLSNTYFFEKERAWTGICIEPRKSQFKKLSRNRSCISLNLCVASVSGKEQFTEFKGAYLPALSGLERNFYSEHRDKVAEGLSYPKLNHHAIRYRVKTETLANILKTHGIAKVDYCSIDVEGSEMEVLAGLDFKAVQVEAFSIENNYRNRETSLFMDDRGYKLVHEIGKPQESLDQIYVKSL
jgi:FkbM family methyltransferase